MARLLLPLALAASLGSLACRKGSSSPASGADDGAVGSGIPSGPEARPAREPLPVAGAPMSGLRVEGAEPRFSWDPVDGAAAYGVSVAGPGRTWWTWAGEGTSVAYGTPSVAIELPAAFGSVKLPQRNRWMRAGAEYRWFVEAYDAKGRPIAAGDTQTFTCAAPCGTLAPPPAAPPAPITAIAEPAAGTAPPPPVPPALPEGLPPAVGEQVRGAMDGILGSVQMEDERPGLPAWQRLAAFAPDQLGEYAASAPATGATATAMGVEMTTTSRDYAGAGRHVEVRITGGEAAHDLTTQFGARIPDRNGPDEIRQHVEVGGRPALVKWSRATGLAEARMPVADLYYVEVTVRPADGPDAAQAALAALDLAGLAALR